MKSAKENQKFLNIFLKIKRNNYFIKIKIKFKYIESLTKTYEVDRILL